MITSRNTIEEWRMVSRGIYVPSSGKFKVSEYSLVSHPGKKSIYDLTLDEALIDLKVGRYEKPIAVKQYNYPLCPFKMHRNVEYD